MKLKLKPYPQYEDSGVKWIGNIPSNWDLVRNKNIFSKSKNIVGDKWEDYPVLSLTKKGVIIRDIESNEGKMPSDFSIYQIVRPSNLLLCLFDIDVTPRCVGYINNKGIVSAAYSEISPTTDIYTKYYYYWYLMLDFDKQLLHLSKNLRNSLSNEDFMALPIVKPSINEQKQISSFLDKKTSEVDLTIKKDTRLIELLKEKRTALINHVVTKGLDPTVKMKDSGVEWIGEIPEDWDTKRLKTVLKQQKNSIKTGPFGSQLKSSDMEDSEVKVYNQRNVLSKNEKIGENFVSNKKYEDLISFKVVPGDLLITTRGTIGKCLRLSNDAEEGLLHPCLMKINNNENIILNTYLELILEYSDLVKIQFFLQSNATTIEVIYQENLKEIYLFIPSISEQNKILDFLENKLSKIDLTIEKIQKNIEFLEEYKKSLIHHVVTGKVDVREVAV